MNKLAINWSVDKYKELEAKLVGYWAENIWDLRDNPTKLKPYERQFSLKFLCPSITVNTEIKYGIWQKVLANERSIPSLASRSCTMLSWFREDFQPTIYSLTQKSMAEWEDQFLIYLAKRGLKTTTSRSDRSKGQGIVQYQHKSRHIFFFHEIYKVVSDFYDTRSEYEKDIWDIDKIGIKRGPTHTCRTLNFLAIEQLWLRQIAKKYLRYCLSIYSLSQGFNILNSLRNFSIFLTKNCLTISPSKVVRSVIVDYLSYLASGNLLPSTKMQRLGNLRTFFEICSREGWASFPKERIIYNEDFPKQKYSLPRFIPNDVLNQLFQHLGELPSNYQRMIYILYEVGMRINELFSLSFDCLMQDSEGSWWVKYHQSKLKQDHTQPITTEIANIIQMQQKEVSNKWGSSAILFPNPLGKPYKRERLARVLNKLAVKKNICDSTGKVWWFEAHQFRHTFGTRCINNGVPHHIVQRLMGHKSPAMTSVYAHIHDETLKNEYAKLLSKRKLIDISGRVLNENMKADAVELQWLKKHIDARTLPNGYCSIPMALAPCPHPNACLTCPHFRTDQTYLEIHQKQLEETVRLFQLSKDKGWQVQINNNEKIITHLQKIITSLKDIENDT